MELQIVENNNRIPNTEEMPTVKSSSNFIEANTERKSYGEIREKHIIPVFAKDNEQVISHTDFVDTVREVGEFCFGQKEIRPIIRVSHPIKGRIPEARNKPAKELLDHEKTIYYQRMAFMMELDNVYQNIDGSLLKLSIGGIKAFNQDNLSSTSGSYQNFNVFIGFKNTVCTNLCIWSDGLHQKLKARSQEELLQQVLELFQEYDAVSQITAMERLTNKSLTEKQFAQLLGRSRLYNYLPDDRKRGIPELIMNDSQVNTIANTYYNDDHFCREEDGSLSLWKMYNLFTGANKSSYIDSFLPRSENAFSFVNQVSKALDGGSDFWFLN